MGFTASGFLAANFMSVAVMIAVLTAAIRGVAIAVVTALGVKVVRLPERWRRNDDKEDRQQRSVLHVCWPLKRRLPPTHHARTKFSPLRKDDTVPNKSASVLPAVRPKCNNSGISSDDGRHNYRVDLDLPK
jgi:predicted RND superfamily exporter protein